MSYRPKGSEMIQLLWNKYSSDLNNALLGVNFNCIEKSLNVCRKAIETNSIIWVIGNGGSAATASHFCVDLSKGCSIRINKKIRALPLMDMVPIQSAWSNDESYEAALEM